MATIVVIHCKMFPQVLSSCWRDRAQPCVLLMSMSVACSSGDSFVHLHPCKAAYVFAVCMQVFDYIMTSMAQYKHNRSRMMALIAEHAPTHGRSHSAALGDLHGQQVPPAMTTYVTILQCTLAVQSTKNFAKAKCIARIQCKQCNYLTHTNWPVAMFLCSVMLPPGHCSNGC